MTAKEWLSRYHMAWQEATDIEQRITDLRLKYARPSAIAYSDMPKAHNNNDLSSYMAQLDKYEKLLIRKYSECIGIEVEIYQTIDKLEDDAERLVLRERYIDGKKWEEIAEDIPCAIRTVYLIHGRALGHLRPLIMH